MRFFLFLIFAVGSLQALSKASPQTQLVEKNIGVQTIEYQDEKRNRPVLVELWYPTSHHGSFDESLDPAWIHPKEMRNAPLTEGLCPLIVMSHGNEGDRRDRSWLVDYLVKKGFMIASVEHHGDSWRSHEPLTNFRFWERARDISFVITELLKDVSLKSRIDSKRIGFIGYSLGGMTGLSLAGGKQQHVKEIILQQNAKYKLMDPKLLEEMDFSEAYSSFFEPRIKAMALLSPAVFGFTEDSLQSIQIPAAIITSKGDEVLPFQEHALKVIKNLISAKVKMLRDTASHYVFLNRVSSVGKGILRKEIQTDTIQDDRLIVHKEIGPFVADFLKENI